MLDATVSFVLFHTRMDEVERAVAQIRQAAADTHLYLVDNSVPGLALPDFDGGDVTIVRANGNIGYGRAHNLAFAASVGRARYHLALNTDLEFDGSVVDTLIRFMDEHPTAGLVMPKVKYPDGSIQRLCRLLPNPSDLLGRRFFSWTRWAQKRNAAYEFHGWDYDSVASFPFLSGCFMMMRRSVLDQVGGFDPRFFLYGEDIDLSRRIHQIADTLYVPSVAVTHEYRSQQRRSLRMWIHGITNLARYFCKWGWIGDRERDAFNRRTLAQFER